MPSFSRPPDNGNRNGNGSGKPSPPPHRGQFSSPDLDSLPLNGIPAAPRVPAEAVRNSSSPRLETRHSSGPVSFHPDSDPHHDVETAFRSSIAPPALNGNGTNGNGAVRTALYQHIAEPGSLQEDAHPKTARELGKRTTGTAAIFMAGALLGAVFALKSTETETKLNPNDGICMPEERSSYTVNYDRACGYCGNGIAEQIEIETKTCFVDTHDGDGKITEYQVVDQEVPVFDNNGRVQGAEIKRFTIAESCNPEIKALYAEKDCASNGVKYKQGPKAIEPELICSEAIKSNFLARGFISQVQEMVRGKYKELDRKCGNGGHPGWLTVKVAVADYRIRLTGAVVTCTDDDRSVLLTNVVLGVVGNVPEDNVTIKGKCSSTETMYINGKK